MKKEETFSVTGVAGFSGNLEKLAAHNPDYDLTKTELIKKGLIGERVYEDIYPCEDVTLAMTDDQIPGVFVTGEQIGYIRKANSKQIEKLMEGGQITELSVTLHGGPYRILLENGDEDSEDEDSLLLEEASAGLFALLRVTYEEKAEEPAGQDNNSTLSYISTSYSTIERDETKKRGTAPLVFALLFGGFYAGFSIPYWILVRQGTMQAMPVLGGDIANNLLNPHIALVLAGLAAAVLGIVIRAAILPMLAALLFTASCYTLPGYALFLLLPALFCIISALRRHSGKFITILKIISLLAVLGGMGYLMKDTVLDTISTHQLAIRPTGEEDSSPLLSLPGAEASDDYDDEDYGDDFMDDDEGDFADDGGGFADNYADDFGEGF